MIGAPLAMLVAIRPCSPSSPERSPFPHSRKANAAAGGSARLGGAGGRVFVAAPSTRASWRCATRRSARRARRRAAGLPADPARQAGALRGQDRYAAYELLGADTHVPLVEFPDPKSPRTRRSRSTPATPTARSTSTPSRADARPLPYVITGRAAWNSQAPPNFKRDRRDPSYLLWKRTGERPKTATCCSRGPTRAPAAVRRPEIRILLSQPGRASLFPARRSRRRRLGRRQPLRHGERTAQSVELPPGAGALAAVLLPFALTLSAPASAAS
jgi:hypothetical protein